jgi:hypothetical protein
LGRRNPTRKSILCFGTRSISDACFGFAIEARRGLSNLTTTVFKKGIVELFTYQVGGASSEKLPHWQWIVTDQASEAEQLNQTFPRGRPTKSGKHHKWDKLFIRVKPADENAD